MQQEHRLIIALAISVLILFLSRMYLTPPPSDNQTRKESVVVSKKDDSSHVQPSEIAESGKKEKVLPPANDKLIAELPATQVAEQKLTVNDPQYKVILSNRGAKIASWQYMEKSGNKYELILQEVPEDLAGCLAVVTEDKSLNEKLNSVNYEIQIGDTTPNNGTYVTPVEINFHYQEGSLLVNKKMRFGSESCLMEVVIEAKRNGDPISPLRVRLGPAMGSQDALLGADTWASQSLVYLNDGTFNQLQYKSIEGFQTISGGIPWAGLQTHYFAVLALAAEGKSLDGSRFASWKYKGKDEKGTEKEFIVAGIEVPMAIGEVQKIFFGPKEDKTLNGVHPLLTRVVDYGWFRIIAEPLLAALRWIHSWIPNYGMAIILLTFIITLALFPLRYKQLISMKKMQKLQPQIRAVQERYKKAKSSAEERQKMNTEMMALYKTHGVNPVGGCLPLLLQFPFFFAFNSMMNNCFDLRGAPFFMWIRNLAAPDPYYITPLIMGVTMYLSMKLTTPPTSDPMQNKMMAWMMPGVMTFMFLGLSAGLNLYFLFSNIFSIAMQKAAERFIPAIRNI